MFQQIDQLTTQMAYLAALILMGALVASMLLAIFVFVFFCLRSFIVYAKNWTSKICRRKEVVENPHCTCPRGKRGAAKNGGSVLRVKTKHVDKGGRA